MIPNPPNMLTWACALMRLNLPKPLNMHALWQFHFTNLQNYSYMYTKICNCWLQQYLYACQCWRCKINTCENCTELKKNEVRSGHWALRLRPGLNRHPQLPVDTHSGQQPQQLRIGAAATRMGDLAPGCTPRLGPSQTTMGECLSSLFFSHTD